MRTALSWVKCAVKAATVIGFIMAVGILMHVYPLWTVLGIMFFCATVAIVAISD